MSSKAQEGIYHRGKSGNSFCLISLRARITKIDELGNTVLNIWNRLMKLKKGITVDLDIDAKHRKIGNLTALIAYGPSLFEFHGAKRNKPSGFVNDLNFKDPALSGNGPVFEGSTISYQRDLSDNHLLYDQILFQFIADNEFYTKRACVEVWKYLHTLDRDGGSSPLRISGLYTGFQREDGRNWFGFHDGVSNLKSTERSQVIFIDPRNLNLSDKWTGMGTYLIFMRIALDLINWEDTPPTIQQIIIGRDKLTGCPLISVDKNRKPVKDSRCPVAGTSEILDPGNEYFRDHRPYDGTTGDKILHRSHIGSTRPIDHIPVWDKRSVRIYRQGFEFLAPSKNPPGFIVGLNFVSFQNTPKRFFGSLNYQRMISKKISSSWSVSTLEKFMSVSAAGTFFVPAMTQGEPFPGAQIFFSSSELRNLSHQYMGFRKN